MRIWAEYTLDSPPRRKQLWEYVGAEGAIYKFIAYGSDVTISFVALKVMAQLNTERFKPFYINLEKTRGTDQEL